MIPLSEPDLSGNENTYLAECVSTNFVSSVGPFVTRLEKLAAEITNSGAAVATSSGTTALHAVLHQMGVRENDHVIIPSFTFIATANAVAHCKATPIVLDIDQSRWCLSASLLEDFLKNACFQDAQGRLIFSETGKSIKAILPVFAMGLPADMNSISNIAKKYDIPILIDAAAAIGAKYRNLSLGEVEADYVVISMNGNKLVTAGGGGLVLAKNEKLGLDLKHLTTTARVGKSYDHDIVGFNYRMTNLQAAVGLAQCERIEEFLYRKLEIANNYKEAFSDIKGVKSFPSVDDSVSSNWLSGIFLPDSSEAEMDSIRSLLRSSKIEAKPFWKPIHRQEPYRNVPNVLNNGSDSIWFRVLPLPCSTNLSLKQQEFVISTVRGLLL